MKKSIASLCFVLVITNLAFPTFATVLYFPEKFYCMGNENRAVTLRLQVAETPEQQAYGLMFRRSIVPFDGMIFRFGREKFPRMWMKNTYLPLDMLFIDKSGKLVQKIENTVPLSEAVISTDMPVTVVIEFEAGRAAREHWDIGTKLSEGSCTVRAARHQP